MKSVKKIVTLGVVVWGIISIVPFCSVHAGDNQVVEEEWEEPEIPVNPYGINEFE